MPHQQENSANNSANKKPKSKLQPFEAIEEAEQKVLDMGRENIKSVKRSTDNFNHKATEYANICSSNMDACVESGNITSRNMQNINHEIMQSWNRITSDMAKLSQEAAGCRNAKDRGNLLNKAAQQTFKNYLHEISKLSGLFLNNFNKAIEPLNERAAVASKQMSKLLAA